jgi:DNA-binding MarR family transcriptional regulator
MLEGMTATPTPAPGALEHDLGWALGSVFRAYAKTTGLALAEVPGGPRGYQVLTAAAQGTIGTQLALANQLGVDRTVMTYLLDDLEAARLLERKPDPEDRRSRQIVLTAKGRRRLAELTDRIAAVEGAILADLTEAEAAQLRHLLGRATTSAAAGATPADVCSLGEALQG